MAKKTVKKPVTFDFFHELNSIFLLLASALLLTLAVPNEFYKTGQPLLVYFCMAPLYLLIHRFRSFRHAALYGIAFGIITTLTIYFWLVNFGTFSAWTLGGVTLAYMITFSLFFPLLYGMFRLFPHFTPLMFSACWTVWEYIKSTGFLGFPWGLLPHPLHSVLPMIQIADITGIWGITFLVALLNAVLGHLFLLWPRLFIRFSNKYGHARLLTAGIPALIRQAALAAVLLALTLAYGIIRLSVPVLFDREVSVLLIQQNKDPWGSDNRIQCILDGQQLTLKGMETVTEKPDIIVWSETSLRDVIIDRAPYFETYPEQEPFLPFIRKLNAYFLVGAPTIVNWKKFDAVNSTVLISDKGVVMGYYGKMHPVPIAESIPLWDVPVVRAFFENVIGISGVWTTADDPKVFEIYLKDGKKLKFSTPICFEDSFPDVCRRLILNGADLWINLTNVSWSRTESAEFQMYVASKFRSIEHRRVLIRSTNAGVTSVIDPYGAELKSIPLFKPGTLFMKVPVYKDKNFTAYTTLGDYLPWVLAAIVIALFVLKRVSSFLKKAKSKK